MYMYLPAEVQPAVYMYDVPYLSTLHVPYLTLRYTLSLAGPASLASFRAIPHVLANSSSTGELCLLIYTPDLLSVASYSSLLHSWLPHSPL